MRRCFVTEITIALYRRWGRKNTSSRERYVSQDGKPWADDARFRSFVRSFVRSVVDGRWNDSFGRSLRPRNSRKGGPLLRERDLLVRFESETTRTLRSTRGRFSRGTRGMRRTRIREGRVSLSGSAFLRQATRVRVDVAALHIEGVRGDRCQASREDPRREDSRERDGRERGKVVREVDGRNGKEWNCLVKMGISSGTLARSSIDFRHRFQCVGSERRGRLSFRFLFKGRRVTY